LPGGDVFGRCHQAPPVVRLMRSDAVEEVLQRQGADEETVQHLVEEGRLRRVHYSGWTCYIRIMEEAQDVEISS